MRSARWSAASPAAARCWPAAMAARPRDAQHFAAEFVGRFERERPGLAAIALTTDRSILTAIANDYDFDADLRQAGAGARRSPATCCWRCRTSGNSANVLAAVEAAHEREMTVDRADRPRRRQDARASCAETDVHICVPHERTARIQEVHLLVAALPVRRGGPAIARRTGTTHELDNHCAWRLARSRCAGRSPARLQRCAPLLVGGAVVGGTMVATDRRTSGAQLEDQAIELKAASRLREALGDRGHVNVTSYNRQVLLTGEVPTEADKAAGRAERGAHRERAARSSTSWRSMAPSSITARSNDTLHHRQGEGELRRREGPARQRLQGRHRARHRLPDGPRHRARGRPRHRDARAASAACRRWCGVRDRSARPSSAEPAPKPEPPTPRRARHDPSFSRVSQALDQARRVPAAAALACTSA